MSEQVYWESLQGIPNKLEHYEFKEIFRGLEIRNTHNHNLAMFGKLVCRILKDSNALWGKLLKEKYFPHSDLLKAKASSNSSSFWKKVN